MGRMILNGTVYGAGAKIKANPSGTATDTLTKLGIDGTIYEIQGGNGNFKTKVLLNQAATSGTYSLDDDYTNYDLLAFWTTGQGYESSEAGVVVMTVDDLKKAQADNRVLTMFGYYNRYYNFNITPSQFTVQSRNDMTVVKIVGYKIYADCYNPIIYSTEEREVGVWTDNKPLYQKTFIITGKQSQIDISSLNIDTYVKSESVYRIGSYCFEMPRLADVTRNYDTYISTYFAELNSGNIYFLWGTGVSSIDELHFTIQYTKTTDVAGSGSYNTLGVPTVHYDGNEKIVGTYYGETLYEKSYIQQLNNGETQISISDLNANYAFIESGFYDIGVTKLALNEIVDINSRLYTYTHINTGSQYLNIDCKNTISATSTIHITIRYTKTTD